MLLERVNGTATEEANPSDNELELDDTEEVESAGGRAFAPLPPFSKLSSLFGPLEEHAESCGISEAVARFFYVNDDFSLAVSLNTMLSLLCECWGARVF